MRRVLSITILTLATFATHGATTRNDDSCDIAVMPAAMLLLPYFEVDLTPPVRTARTTLFTVINTLPHKTSPTRTIQSARQPVQHLEKQRS